MEEVCDKLNPEAANLLEFTEAIHLLFENEQPNKYA